MLFERCRAVLYAMVDSRVLMEVGLARVKQGIHV